MPLTEKELLKRDAKRDIGAELLRAVRDIKAGKGRRFKVGLSPIAAARQKAELSQSEFAQLLGVSVRTLQDWEQGRRQPTGAARSLLLVAVKQPKMLRDVLKEMLEAA
jgi:putative transcriptional regulator